MCRFLNAEINLCGRRCWVTVYPFTTTWVKISVILFIKIKWHYRIDSKQQINFWTIKNLQERLTNVVHTLKNVCACDYHILFEFGCRACFAHLSLEVHQKANMRSFNRKTILFDPIQKKNKNENTTSSDMSDKFNMCHFTSAAAGCTLLRYPQLA